MDITQIRALAPLMHGNAYSDETFGKMAPHRQVYRDARATLRALPLGEAPSALAMLAGGRR